MTAESIAPYSPDTIYGQLTSPFIVKQVTINAHTPYDDTEAVQNDYAQEYFYRNTGTKSVYGDITPHIENEYTEFGEKISSEDAAADISNFSSSELTSSDIINKALNNGYSANDAMSIKIANNAYQKMNGINAKPSERLSTCSFRVF